MLDIRLIKPSKKSKKSANQEDCFEAVDDFVIDEKFIKQFVEVDKANFLDQDSVTAKNAIYRT